MLSREGIEGKESGWRRGGKRQREALDSEARQDGVVWGVY